MPRRHAADVLRAERPTHSRFHGGILDRPYTQEETKFLRAIQDYKSQGHPYPSWLDLLRIIKELGYSRPESELPRVAKEREEAAAVTHTVQLDDGVWRKVLALWSYYQCKRTPDDIVRLAIDMLDHTRP